MTTVISVRGRDCLALLADPNFVYVGRKCAGWSGSIWGNPFKPYASRDTGHRIKFIETGSCRGFTFDEDRFYAPSEVAHAAVRYYAGWLIHQSVLIAKLPQLRGKVLGCWCCDWDGSGEPSKPCHAIVLARLADQPPEAH